MRRNQITIQVTQIDDVKSTKFSTYCDSNDFYEALAGAVDLVMTEVKKGRELPEFGTKSVIHNPHPLNLTVIDGDIFDTDAEVIVHQVNCQGKMGSGVAKQVRDKYPNVYTVYRGFCENQPDKDKLLGEVLYVETDNGKIIANMFSQLNYGYDGKVYTNYPAFDRCLKSINERCAGKTVAIPYNIGCCRGGGDWKKISNMIAKNLNKCDLTLYKYTK